MSIHEKWFTSDTHFFHNNILKFKQQDGSPMRPGFKSCQEMDEHMVKCWNSVVGENDYVYHLGDVTFQYNKLFQELAWSLKGKKRLIVGNHDKLKQDGLLKHFEKVEYWKGFGPENFTCTHVPHMLDRIRDGEFNVHGHTHNAVLADPHYINVCVEVRDYTPIHMDTILEHIKQVKS